MLIDGSLKSEADGEVARQCGDARTELGDARLRSERASGESLRKACPALLSVMSGFIRRDRGLNCINSRLFPIVFWWNLQPIKAAQLLTEDSPRIPEDQLNKRKKRKITMSLPPLLFIPLSPPPAFYSISPSISFSVSVVTDGADTFCTEARCCSWPIGGVFELIIIPERARHHPCPCSWRKNKSCISHESKGSVIRQYIISRHHVWVLSRGFVSGWMLLKHV